MANEKTSKLQSITRSNGSTVHHLNIPLDEIEKSQLKKGDLLLVKTLGPGHLEVKKKDDM